MTRTSLLFCSLVAVGIAMLAPATTFAQAEKNGHDKLQESINKVLEKMTNLEKNFDKVAADQAALKLEQLKLRAELDAYKTVVDDLVKKLGSGSPAPVVDKAFMDELRASLKAMNETIAKFGPGEKRMSMYPATNGNPLPARVVFVNMYNEDLLVTLNGMQYLVPARTTRTMEGVATGVLRYEVFSFRWRPRSPGDDARLE